MPVSAVLPACAVRWLPEPTTASVSLSSVATPTATPTPTKPPARLAVISRSFVSSFAVSRTLLPAEATTPVPVLAKVCSCRMVTAAHAGDDRDDRGLAAGDHGDVAPGIHLRAVVDEGIGVQRDQVHPDADTDAGGAADSQCGGDADLVELVARRHAHRVRAGAWVGGAVQAAVDHRVLADVCRGVRGHDRNGAGEVNCSRARESGAHADRGYVVAVRRRHRNTAEGRRVVLGLDRAWPHLAGVARGGCTVRDDAVRLA